MSKRLTMTILALLFITSVTYADNFCSALNSTQWQGVFVTIGKVGGTIVAKCRIRIDQFNVNGNSVSIKDHLISASGPLKSKCPGAKQFVSDLTCRNNHMVTYLRRGDQDKVHARFRSSTLMRGRGHFVDKDSRGLPVNYHISLKKQQ